MKSKKITIWSTKGGVGKTSICAELHFRLGWPVVTNEEDSMLSTIINSDKLKILKPKEKIQSYNNNILFDFGGYIDHRIVDALEQSDCVIVPTLPEIPDIQGCLNSIKSIMEYNKNIVVIVNKTEDKNDFLNVKNIILDVFNVHLFEIKKTRAIPNIYINKKSILQIMENNKLLNYVYRKIDIQFTNIITYINNF